MHVRLGETTGAQCCLQSQLAFRANLFPLPSPLQGRLSRVRLDERKEPVSDREAERLLRALLWVECQPGARWDYEACRRVAPLTLEIGALKRERDAVILTHSYVDPEIVYGVGDFRGDSYFLSQQARDCRARTIVFAGVVFMAEKEAFVGPLAWYLRRMGGLAVDRAAPGGVVDQVASRLREADRMWFVLAPEGTRRRVDKWKTGFWKIARAADVPVLCAAFDYPNRCVRIGPLIRCSDDVEADMARIRAWYRPFMGKNRGTV